MIQVRVMGSASGMQKKGFGCIYIYTVLKVLFGICVGNVRIVLSTTSMTHQRKKRVHRQDPFPSPTQLWPGGVDQRTRQPHWPFHWSVACCSPAFLSSGALCILLPPITVSFIACFARWLLLCRHTFGSFAQSLPLCRHTYSWSFAQLLWLHRGSRRSSSSNRRV